MKLRSSLNWHDRKLTYTADDHVQYEVPCYLTQKDWTNEPSVLLHTRIVKALNEQGIPAKEAIVTSRTRIVIRIEAESS